MPESDSPETQPRSQRAPGGGSGIAVAAPSRVAVVCALEREVAPLVRGWRVEIATDGFKRYKVFENERAAVVVAGMGKTPARHAAELALERSGADVLISAGFAGETVGGLQIGGPYTPATVLDAESGAKYSTLFGLGVLATAPGVLGQEEKQGLFDRCGAYAVDMEAAAVAEVAQRHGAGFLAVKAISDLHDFAMPPMQRFVDERGDFHAARFVAWTLLRPGTWGRVWQLGRNSAAAGKTLQRLLAAILEIEDLKNVKMSGTLLCPRVDG